MIRGILDGGQHRAAGNHVRLEPLEMRHAAALAAAAEGRLELYRWSPIPQGEAEAGSTSRRRCRGEMRERRYHSPPSCSQTTSLSVLRGSSTWNVGRGHKGHALPGRTTPDACEIGYTWLNVSAIRTPINTEAKLLMLTYAFEQWRVLRVCLHTDVRNTRSRAAIERIGGKFEGILRAHRMAADFIARDRHGSPSSHPNGRR